MDTMIDPAEYKAFSLDARAALAASGMSEDALQMLITRTGTDAAYVAAIYGIGQHLWKICDRATTPSIEELPLVLEAVRGLLAELEAALVEDEVRRPIERTFNSPGDLLGATFMLMGFGMPLKILGRNKLEMARRAAKEMLARFVC